MGMMGVLCGLTHRHYERKYERELERAKERSPEEIQADRAKTVDHMGATLQTTVQGLNSNQLEELRRLASCPELKEIIERMIHGVHHKARGKK